MIRFILLVDHRSGLAGEKLSKAVRENFPQIPQEYLASIEEFHERLCLPVRSLEHELYILLADTTQRLELLMDERKLLEGRRLFLIVPGHQKEVLSMGHRLRPRYMSTGTDNIEELVSVLEKTIGKLKTCDVCGVIGTGGDIDNNDGNHFGAK